MILNQKRELYERFGVREYWFVDLDADQVEVRRIAEGRYEEPIMIGRGDALDSPMLPGLAIPVDDILGPAET